MLKTILINKDGKCDYAQCQIGAWDNNKGSLCKIYDYLTSKPYI